MEAQSALASGEEALAVSVWSVATLCRALSLENVMSMLVGALLEKQMVVICPNLVSSECGQRLSPVTLG